jgi:DNA-binding MarR family transcriptional regulator
MATKPSSPHQPPTSPAASRSLAEEIGKRHGFESPEQEAYLNILRTSMCLATDFERLFRTHGLSEATYNALRILRGHYKPGNGGGGGGGGVPSQTIGKQLITNVPDVTRLVDRLVDAGLAERCRIEADRRVVMVKITKAGLDLLAKLDRPLRELHIKQLGHMGRRELEQLSQLLVKARQRMVVQE